MPDIAFDAGELLLDDLSVTAMRDAVALPEAGASGASCSCNSSCCCQQEPIPTFG
jgi:hypothetical protein